MWNILIFLKYFFFLHFYFKSSEEFIGMWKSLFQETDFLKEGAGLPVYSVYNLNSIEPTQCTYRKLFEQGTSPTTTRQLLITKYSFIQI